MRQMHVIVVEGVRYLWNESTTKLYFDEEFICFAATPARARDYAAQHRRACLPAESYPTVDMAVGRQVVGR